MAIAVEINFPGATLAQYDQVVKKMGFRPEGSGPPGALFHWATKTDNGFRVVDVWRSREDFDKFSQEKIGPLSREAGISAQPDVRFVEVHNYLTAG